MTTSEATKQVNLRTPVDTAGHLDRLAVEAGTKLPGFAIGILERAADEYFINRGRQAVLDELRAEYETQVAHYNEYFDDLEARRAAGDL